MAKALLVFSLLTVLTVSGYRILARSDNFEREAGKRKQALFKMKRYQIVEKLEELNAVVKRPVPELSEQDSRRVVLVERLEEKQVLLEEEVYSQGHNFEALHRLRAEIGDLKKELGLDLLLTEKESIEMVYYLILEQGMTFSEINNIDDLNDAVELQDWKFAQSEQFRRAIYEYKNIEFDESEFSDRVPASYDDAEEESFDSSEEYYEEET